MRRVSSQSEDGGRTYIEEDRIFANLTAGVRAPGAGSLSTERKRGSHRYALARKKPKPVIQHEACYQNEPNKDKWPYQSVQKFFKKVKKKLVTPGNVDNA